MPLPENLQSGEKLNGANESSEALERLTELYLERVARFKSQVMESTLTDKRKAQYLRRIDSQLQLIDLDDLKFLQIQFERFLDQLQKQFEKEKSFQSKEEFVSPVVSGGTFILEKLNFQDVMSDELRKEMETIWARVKVKNGLYLNNFQHFNNIIAAKGLKIEGTELQWIKNALTAQYLHLSELFEDLCKVSVGNKLIALRDYEARLKEYYEAIEDALKKLDEIKSSDDLLPLNPQDSLLISEGALKLAQKVYQAKCKEFFYLLDNTKISKESIEYADQKRVIEAYDEQLGLSIEEIEKIPDLDKRRVAMDLLTKKIQNYSQEITEACESFSFRNEEQGTKRAILEGSKNIEKLKNFFGKIPPFIVPQMGIALGYAGIWNDPSRSSTDKALETADFGFSLIPFAGGIYDVVSAMRGETLSGRAMATTEATIRGLVGAGSLILDCFTFGNGGLILKGGVKSLMKGGIEITSKVAAREIAEASAKGLAKELAEKGSVQIGEKVFTKEMFEEGALLGLKKALEAGNRTEIRQAMAEVIQKYFLEGLEKEATEILAKEMAQKSAQEAAAVATKTPLLPSFIKLPGKINVGAMAEVGGKALTEDILKSSAKKELMESSVAAGRRIFDTDFYLSKQFLSNSGALSMGKIGEQMGKEFLSLHNPLALLGHLNPKKLFRIILRDPAILTKEELRQVKSELRVTMLSEMKGVSLGKIDDLLRQLEKDGFELFMSKNRSQYSWLENEENQGLLKAFSEKIGKTEAEALKAA